LSHGAAEIVSQELVGRGELWGSLLQKAFERKTIVELNGEDLGIIDVPDSSEGLILCFFNLVVAVFDAMDEFTDDFVSILARDLTLSVVLVLLVKSSSINFRSFLDFCIDE